MKFEVTVTRRKTFTVEAKDSMEAYRLARRERPADYTEEAITVSQKREAEP